MANVTGSTTATSPAVAADQERLLSVKEARAKLGIGHSTIYSLFNTGALHSTHVGRNRKVRLSDLLSFMSRTTRPTSSGG